MRSHAHRTHSCIPSGLKLERPSLLGPSNVPLLHHPPMQALCNYQPGARKMSKSSAALQGSVRQETTIRKRQPSASGLKGGRQCFPFATLKVLVGIRI